MNFLFLRQYFSFQLIMVSKQKYIIKNQNRVSKNKIKKLR